MWKILLTKRTGSIIDIVVYDCFMGSVKLLKKRWGKFYVEIVDVSMCYPCSRPLRRGERLWIENELIYTKKSVLERQIEKINERLFLALKKRRKEENDLPF